MGIRIIAEYEGDLIRMYMEIKNIGRERKHQIECFSKKEARQAFNKLLDQLPKLQKSVRAENKFRETMEKSIAGID